MRARGLIVAAPASGSGKTTVTLGLLRAFRDRGVTVSPLKAGPDYIDPGFHGIAADQACANVDAWAMRPSTRASIITSASDADLVLCEGVMGLFDGATASTGSTADLAAETEWPVILVVDAKAQAASAAAVVRGFSAHRPAVRVAGVVFNRVGGERHRRHIADAMADQSEIAVLGYLPHRPDLTVPSRHLGLVQAMELDSIETMIAAAARHVGAHLDLDAVQELAGECAPLGPAAPAQPPVPPLGQRIAVADDEAFAFRYGYITDAWRASGAELAPFSPLAGEGPDGDADAVYLPGGYPELHADRISANAAFMDGLCAIAGRGAPIFGECGGYMALGEGLVDADGNRHRMAGLLPVETSFADRKLHLGYRRARVRNSCVLGSAGAVYRAHEFHYASIVNEGSAAPLFDVEDAFGDSLPPAGVAHGSVIGSFIHLIDREDA